MGEAGAAQDMLTWVATMVQSLANSTCPERANMMTLRKEVNHITHSKSATSWGGPGRLGWGRGVGWAGPWAGQSPSTAPAPVFFLHIRAEPQLEGPALPSEGSTRQGDREE